MLCETSDGGDEEVLHGGQLPKRDEVKTPERFS